MVWIEGRQWRQSGEEEGERKKDARRFERETLQENKDTSTAKISDYLIKSIAKSIQPSERNIQKKASNQ